MPLTTEQSPFIPASQGSPQNARVAANRVRSSAPDVATGFDQLQNQIDLILKSLRTPPPLNDLYVTNTAGQVIVWIGSRLANGKQYFGGYFAQLYVGGSDASNAPTLLDNSGLRVTDNATGASTLVGPNAISLVDGSSIQEFTLIGRTMNGYTALGAVSVTLDAANGNANVTGVYKVGGTQVVGARQGAITGPSGGTTIDSQARTAINSIISALHAHGLIG